MRFKEHFNAISDS